MYPQFSELSGEVPLIRRWQLVLASRADVCTRGIILLVLLMYFLAGTHLLAQTPVTTWHYDNQRTSQNITESVLTPQNVNSQTFGKLFTQPVDGYIVGHPLYLPGLSILGKGTYNVVFVATMHDSVYAFDADNPNTEPLWVTSLLSYSPAGATTVPTSVQKNGGTTGWVEVGVISTPVIDPNSGILYLVAETYEGGKVIHRLHALDVTTGQEALGGPTTITATYDLNGGISTFADLYQINRPGLLLANNHVYIAFGSNCCNDYSQGWVMSYNASTLQQEGTFDVEPGSTLASIWQKGAGLSADADGNIYAETGEGFYSPGTNLSESVFKLSQIGTTLSLADWFTPSNNKFLSTNDDDLDQAVLVLPDQPGPVAHEMIGIGKVGTIYLLNRDNMGQLCSACTGVDTQIVQELPSEVGRESGTPVYWNNTVYFTGQSMPVMAFTLNNGLLTVPPSAQSIKMGGGGHALITANGTKNGILWFINGSNALFALDALTLQVLYTSAQAANGRDTVPPLAHFATPVSADGKVFLGTQNSLVEYGLLPNLSITGGSGQSGAIGSTLPVPLSVQVIDTYTGNVVPGLTITFSDSGKGGSFNPSSAVTDQTGSASSSYTLPAKGGSYTLTASAPGYATGFFKETAAEADLTETAVSNPPATILGGAKFSVSDTAQNIGTGVAAASTTRYYLSPTASKSGARLLSGTRAVPSLNPGATSSGTVTVTVYAGTAAGTYYLLACANDTSVVKELSTTNDCTASANTTTISGADLTETTVSDPPATIGDGGSFSVSDTAQNIGNVTAAATTTRYYLSTTTSRSGARLLTGSRAVPSLNPGDTSSGTATVTVPAGTAVGTYFLLACADDTFVVPEISDSNNCKASANQVTVSGPDLTETAVSDPPAAVVAGSNFPITDTVQNIGSGAAGASTARYYLSTTASKSGAHLLIGNRAVPSLGPGATSSGTTTVVVPAGTAAGTYFVLACADDTNVVPEINETNNCRTSVNNALVSGPDLAETGVSQPLATVADGSSFPVTDTVQNIGSVAAAASKTRYYLSSTKSKTGAHLLTGSRSVPSLAPGATSVGTVTVTVPAGLPSGTYFLLTCSDDTLLVPEVNESNNCTASTSTTTH